MRDALKIVQIEMGAHHVVARRANGTVVTWGGNDEGQCDVPDGLRGVVDVAAGNYSLALTDQGYVIKWGAHQLDEFRVPNGLRDVV